VVASAASGDDILLPVLIATLIGLILTAAYMGLIAQHVSDGRLTTNVLIQRLPRYTLLLLGLLLLDASIGLGITIALSLIASIFLIMGLGFIQALVQFALLAVVMWVVMVTTLAMFTLFLDDCTLSQAIRRSLLVLRLNSGGLIGLMLISGAISLLLSNIWSLPSSDSWVMLVSIIGQAIVSTGLITGLFIFYQARYRETVSQQLLPSVQQTAIEDSK